MSPVMLPPLSLSIEALSAGQHPTTYIGTSHELHVDSGKSERDFSVQEMMKRDHQQQ